MRLTYDPNANIAYIHLRKKKAKVRTVRVSDELNVDLAADGERIYGIELLNANEQLSADHRNAVVVENEASGESSEIAAWPFNVICQGEADDLPEQAFLYVGGLDDVRARAKEMAK